MRSGDGFPFHGIARPGGFRQTGVKAVRINSQAEVWPASPARSTSEGYPGGHLFLGTGRERLPWRLVADAVPVRVILIAGLILSLAIVLFGLILVCLVLAGFRDRGETHALIDQETVILLPGLLVAGCVSCGPCGAPRASDGAAVGRGAPGIRGDGACGRRTGAPVFARTV